jgi:hypothetical protein
MKPTYFAPDYFEPDYWPDGYFGAEESGDQYWFPTGYFSEVWPTGYFTVQPSGAAGITGTIAVTFPLLEAHATVRVGPEEFVPNGMPGARPLKDSKSRKRSGYTPGRTSKDGWFSEEEAAPEPILASIDATFCCIRVSARCTVDVESVAKAQKVAKRKRNDAAVIAAILLGIEDAA